MDTSNDIDDAVIVNVISNVYKMIDSRGFDMSKVNRYPAQEYVNSNIKLFRDGRNSLDLYLENTDDSKDNYGKKLYVHFMHHMQNIKKSAELVKLHDMLQNAHDLNHNDHIIIVIFHELTETIMDIEKNHPNLTIFSHKKLLFNVIDHEYVPQHELVSPVDKVKLLSDLMISDYDKLPLINKSDVICRYYNYRIGDVIKITRPSLAGKTHVIYRYVQDIV
tara:strand:+ start:35 stop:694 length:660 start_codon:yes stop_codon:yes gene_type:complete